MNCQTETSILNIGIFSLLNLDTHGGLETYVLDLTRGLTQRDIGVNWNGTRPSENPDWHSIWQPRIDRLLPAMTRPALRWIPERYSRIVGRPQVDNATISCDVIHIVGTGWQLFGFPLISKARRMGIPVTCWPAVHPGTWGDAPIDIDFYNALDTVFVQSDFEANYLGSLGVLSPNFVRCGCACSEVCTGNAERFRSTYKLKDKTLVLFIGRKTRGKGYHQLREAIRHLNQNEQSVILVSIGRDLEPPYPSLPLEIDCDLGAADDATKQDALAACDLFALPSEAESFGIVYVEAWNYAKPVICGTAAASRELVGRHAGGWLSDGTPGSIVTQIQCFLSDRSIARQLGQAGHFAVESEYTLPLIVDKHISTWRDLKELE